MILDFQTYDLAEYQKFLMAKRIPEFRVVTDGVVASGLEFPDRFAHFVGAKAKATRRRWLPLPEHLFDDQRAIVMMALEAERFAIWKDCGLGKTCEQLEWARQVVAVTKGRVLIVTMNEVVPQTVEEARKFYGDSLSITVLPTRAAMREWCAGEGPGIAITNYEKFNPDDDGQEVHEVRSLAGIALDESSRLKTGGGKQKWAIIKSTKGIRYKLSCTATPAPNDVMEFASQASFLERMRAENEIIWTWFTRHPKTNEWTVKPHARPHFFRWMASWSIYVRDPKTFGWRSGLPDVPAPNVKRHDVAETVEQGRFRLAIQSAAAPEGSGDLFSEKRLGLAGQGKLMQAARGFFYPGKDADEKDPIPVASLKPMRVAQLAVDAMAAGKQVLIWTQFNEEARIIARLLPTLGVSTSDFYLLDGGTPKKKRQPMLEAFRHGESRCLIAKGKMLGYGLNFQCCRSMIFSAITDSFEDFYQEIRRAVRYGQTEAVDVHLVIVNQLEGPVLSNLLAKQENFTAIIAEMERAYLEALKELQPSALPAAA